MKTDLKIFPQLENRIRELHSYEVAEIIALPIVNISPPYLDWMQNNLRSS
jgi:periplasmic divalent cation tolerance protein